MRNAQTDWLALKDHVKTLAKFLTLLAVKLPSALCSLIDQFATVHQDGPEIQILSVTSVSFKFDLICTWKLTSLFLLTTRFCQILDECRTNSDCPFDKACLNNECQDPCTQTSCGSKALCKAQYHSGICFCPAGLQGNPIVQCLEVGCHHDDDCGNTERCNRASGKCIRLCAGEVCARGAQCTASNHRETCTCSPPLKGDGHVYCAEGKVHGMKPTYNKIMKNAHIKSILSICKNTVMKAHTRLFFNSSCNCQRAWMQDWQRLSLSISLLERFLSEPMSSKQSLSG